MADQPLESTDDRADEVVRNQERDRSTKDPQQALPDDVEQDLEEDDRFQATDN